MQQAAILTGNNAATNFIKFGDVELIGSANTGYANLIVFITISINKFKAHNMVQQNLLTQILPYVFQFHKANKKNIQFPKAKNLSMMTKSFTAYISAILLLN